MRWLASVRERWRSTFRPDQVDEELTRELQFHLDREAEENIAAGMSPEAARLAAMRALGGVTRVQEECREVRRLALLEDLRQDLRYAWRSLARTPGFSAVAILTLALGIGANTAIFTVINAVLVRPLPLPAADRLVTIIENRPSSAPFDGRPARRPPLPEDIRVLQAQVRSLDAVYLYGGAPEIELDGVGSGPAITGARLQPEAMSTLGAQALLGRLPHAGESDVIVLSAEAWRRHFNADRQVIGRTLAATVGNVPSMQATRVYTVVGVLAPGFAFPDAGVDYWLAAAGPLNVARLRRGVSLAAAAAEVSTLLTRLAGKASVAVAPAEPPRFELVSLQEQMVGPIRPALQLLGLVVAVILVIACANVANLLLARSTGRTREIAIRAALGAGRGRLVRQMLAESLLLAGLGGIAGVSLAFGGVQVLRTLFAGLSGPPTIRQVGAGVGPAAFPRLDEVQLDLTTLLFAVAVCMLTGVLFGLAPALRQTAALNLTMLRDGAAGAVHGFALFRRNALRSSLVILQIALAITLLVGGGLLLHSLLQLLTVSRGFDASNVLTFEVRHPRGEHTVPTVRAFAEALTQQLESTPGVVAAAYAHDMPLIGPAQTTPLFSSRDERPPRPSGPGASTSSPALRLVSRGFFSVTGTRIVAGRGFPPGGRSSPPAIIINETLARARFAGKDPIGRLVYLGRDGMAGTPLEIVGVVEDMRQGGLDVAAAPQAFVDFATWPGVQTAFDEPNYYAVRTSVDPRLLVPPLRLAIERVAPGATLEHPLTLDDVVASSLARPRTYAILLGSFAAVALLLAAIGVYGVMAYAVAQSRRELAVRLALGARPAQVVRFVLGRAAILTALGIAIGLPGAFVATRSLQAALVELSALDPLAYLASAVLFASVAMLASYVPARRATRVDPVVTLRAD